MNIMDNIWLGRYFIKGIFIDIIKCFKDIKNLFEKFSIEFNFKWNVSFLSILEM